MVIELTLCPICGNGTLVYNEIETCKKGEYTGTNYFSCNHKVDLVNVSTSLACSVNVGKMTSKSKEKITSKKHVHEMFDKYKIDDRDKQGEPTVETIFKNRCTVPTSVFHVVRYIESNELKHIDCKTCGNTWRFDSQSSVDSQFILEFNSDEKEEGDVSYLCCNKIQCLSCGAKYEK